MRSENPTLNEETFKTFAEKGHFNQAVGRMTVEGTINKTAILLLLTVISASFTWSQMLTGDPRMSIGWAMGGALGAFIVAMVTCFRPTAARFTAPIYAILEGLFLGAISMVMDYRYPGIVPQAVALTFAVMAAMLVAYRSGVLRASGPFVLGVVAATGAVALFSLVLMAGSMFSPGFADFMWQPSPLSIGINLVVIAIAALNLILDFSLIEDGAKQGAPKSMEWYGGFSLMVTLVWLYLRILQLLSLLSRRN